MCSFEGGGGGTPGASGGSSCHCQGPFKLAQALPANHVTSESGPPRTRFDRRPGAGAPLSLTPRHGPSLAVGPGRDPHVARHVAFKLLRTPQAGHYCHLPLAVRSAKFKASWTQWVLWYSVEYPVQPYLPVPFNAKCALPPWHCRGLPAPCARQCF